MAREAGGPLRCAAFCSDVGGDGVGPPAFWLAAQGLTGLKRLVVQCNLFGKRRAGRQNGRCRQQEDPMEVRSPAKRHACDAEVQKPHCQNEDETAWNAVVVSWGNVLFGAENCVTRDMNVWVVRLWARLCFRGHHPLKELGSDLDFAADFDKSC